MASKLVAFFLVPFYTNVFTVEEFGAIALIASVKGIISLISNLNIHSGVARYFFEADTLPKRKVLISTGLWSIVIISFAVFFIMLFLRKLIIIDIIEIPKYELPFLIMIVSIPFDSVFSYFAILIRFEKKKFQFAFGILLQLVIQVGIILLLILRFKLGIESVFIGRLIGSIIVVFLFTINLKKYFVLKIKNKILKNIILYSLPLLPAVLGDWINTSAGQILIQKYLSLEDVGVYSLALRITSVFLIINIAFRNVWTPYLFELIKNKLDYKSQIFTLFKSVILVLIIISGNIIIFSKPIVLLFSNSAYLEASKYLGLLVLAMFFLLMNNFAFIGPQIKKKTIFLSGSTIIGGITNILLMVIFLPFFGVIIVPISLILSTFLTMSISFFITKKLINISFPAVWIFLSIIVMLVLYFISLINPNNLQLVIEAVLFNLFFIISIYILIKHKKFNLGLIDA